MSEKADYFLSELLRALDEYDEALFNRYAEALVKLAYRGRVPSEKPLPGGRTKRVAVMDGWRREPLNAIFFRKLSRNRTGWLCGPCEEIGNKRWKIEVFSEPDGRRLWSRELNL